jgi:hypothetical protein
MLFNPGMARRTAGRKAYRVLDFLSGLEDEEIREALGGHGFSDADLERGWELLRGVGQARQPAPPPSLSDREVTGAIDAWENRWFVVADAALATHHPKVHAWLFRGLTRQSGFQVVFSVGVLIERLRKLDQRVAGLGKEAAEARALLHKRGLSDAVLADAERMIAEVQQGPPLPKRQTPARDVDAAEASMWNWYLEWSRIAQAVLSEPRLLNHVGLGKRGRPPKQGASA